MKRHRLGQLQRQPFDCDAHPNPIQVYGAQAPPPPFNTEELDLGTGAYAPIVDFSPVPPTTPPYGSQNVNGFALMRNPTDDKVYAFICVFDELKLVRYDNTRSTDVPPGAGSLTGQRVDPAEKGQKVNAAAFIKTTYYYTSRLKQTGSAETWNSIFYVSDVNTDTPLTATTSLRRPLRVPGGAQRRQLLRVVPVRGATETSVPALPRPAPPAGDAAPAAAAVLRLARPAPRPALRHVHRGPRRRRRRRLRLRRLLRTQDKKTRMYITHHNQSSEKPSTSPASRASKTV